MIAATVPQMRDVVLGGNSRLHSVWVVLQCYKCNCTKRAGLFYALNWQKTRKEKVRCDLGKTTWGQANSQSLYNGMAPWDTMEPDMGSIREQCAEQVLGESDRHCK